MQIICFILNNLAVCGFMEFHPLFSNLCIFIYLYYSSVIFLTFVVSDLNILTTQVVTFMYIELFIVFFIYHLMSAGSVGQPRSSFIWWCWYSYIFLSSWLLARALSISSIFFKEIIFAYIDFSVLVFQFYFCIDFHY